MLEKPFEFTLLVFSAHTTIKNVAIEIKKARENKSVSCEPKSKVFSPGMYMQVVCGINIVNMIILTNGPNEKELAICEVEVYGKLQYLLPVETSYVWPDYFSFPLN